MSLVSIFHKFLTKEKIIVILIILIGLVSSIYSFFSHDSNGQIIINNSTSELSQQCIGDACQQTITYNTINQEERQIYVSPAKKLIKANMSDYSFPLKIVNEIDSDFNNVGLGFAVPENYGVYRVIIDPKDQTEKITKYNGSMQIMLPCFGTPQNGSYYMICNIESVYKFETKEYTVTINTRDYSDDIYIDFFLYDLSQDSELQKIFRGFGAE